MLDPIGYEAGWHRFLDAYLELMTHYGQDVNRLRIALQQRWEKKRVKAVSLCEAWHRARMFAEERRQRGVMRRAVAAASRQQKISARAKRKFLRISKTMCRWERTCMRKEDFASRRFRSAHLQLKRRKRSEFRAMMNADRDARRLECAERKVSQLLKQWAKKEAAQKRVERAARLRERAARLREASCAAREARVQARKDAQSSGLVARQLRHERELLWKRMNKPNLTMADILGDY